MNSQNKDRQEKGKEAEDNILALHDESETAHETTDQKELRHKIKQTHHKITEVNISSRTGWR